MHDLQSCFSRQRVGEPPAVAVLYFLTGAHEDARLLSHEIAQLFDIGILPRQG